MKSDKKAYYQGWAEARTRKLYCTPIEYRNHGKIVLEFPSQMLDAAVVAQGSKRTEYLNLFLVCMGLWLPFYSLTMISKALKLS